MKPRRLFLLLSALLTGCVVFEAPYKPPVPVEIDLRTVDESTLIPYRRLVASDFKATTYPGKEQSKYVDALTVAFVMSTPCTLRTFLRTEADSSYFEAVVDSFGFEARMSQTHSWLNPKHNGTLRHILAHEQTHFAISEVAARRANMQIAEIQDRIRSRARSDTTAFRAANNRLQSELKHIWKGVAERNIEFDENTKNGQRFRRDDLWRDRLEKELKETAAFATPKDSR